MKKLLMFLMSFILLFTISCDDDSSIVGGGIDIEPELTGCEATPFYDWSDFQFETSLDAGATTWLGFDLSETTLFSINFLTELLFISPIISFKKPLTNN